MPLASLDAIRARIGEEVGISGWLTVDQSRIDAFADATEDRQFIHVDPDAAAQTPFGGTIGHGFRRHPREHRQGQEAVAYRSAERSPRGSLWIGVDELPVFGRVGEGVYAMLADDDPVGDADLATDHRPGVLDRRNWHQDWAGGVA